MFSRLFRRRPPARRPDLSARRVRELELITARLLRAGFAGEYHAAFHGRGIEFSQVREYQPGDDIRTIDWNVTARSGIPHVKQFIEERDLTVIVAMDVSGSMGFGSLDRRKADVAAELTAVLAFAAVQNGDRVGLLLFGGPKRIYVPPRKGRTHAQRLIRIALAESEVCRGSEPLGPAVTHLQNLLPKRSVICILSDWVTDPHPEVVRRLTWKHDVIAMVITDPREERLTSRGLVTLRDAESGERRTVDLRRVQTQAAARRTAVRDVLLRAGVDALDLDTVTPYDRRLLRFFEERIARRR